jgi:hypothetical protein
VAPPDNHTVVPPSEQKHEEEKSNKEGAQQQHPSNVVVVEMVVKSWCHCLHFNLMERNLQIRMTLLLLLIYVAKIKR